VATAFRAPNPEYHYWTDCVSMPGPKAGELVNAIRHHPRDRAVSYQTFARHADLAPLRASGHPAMYRISAPDNWAISFHRSRLPSGAPVYYFAWSGIEHFFVKEPVDVDAEVAAMGGRQHNPTGKRLAWIAQRSPDPVLYDTVIAFAAATAQHALIEDIRYGRRGDSRGLTEPFSPSLVLKLASRPGESTPYDRHLPWVAAVLNREHKLAMKTNRRVVAAIRIVPSYVAGVSKRAQEDVVEGLREAQNVDEIGAWLLASDVVAKQYAQRRAALSPTVRGPDGRARATPAQGHLAYKRAASKLEENLIAIVDWAEAERIDLNTYKELEDVIEQAHTWAEAQVDCDAPSRTVYCWPDGWTVVELESTDELVCEGRILAHCAKDYTIDDLVIGGGDSRFFSLRDPTGKRVTTMMFDTTKRNVPGHALRGFANKTPEVPELARMYEFRMTHPALRPLWRDNSEAAGQWLTRSSEWEGRYSREEYDHLGRAVGWETLDLFSSGLFDADEVSRAHDWMLQAFGDSEYDSAMEWFKSAEFAEQREHAGLPPMTESEMEEAASEESERERQEQLDGFDPETRRHDYGYQIAERTFHGQDRLAGDLAWVHYLATGEDLGGWDEGDEMVDWMQGYRQTERPRTGVAFFGTKEPAIYDHARGSARTAYPFPPGSDYGVIMRLVVPEKDATGHRPPASWHPERLHFPGTVECVATTKARLLA
jgi:hypothetical protein